MTLKSFAACGIITMYYHGGKAESADFAVSSPIFSEEI